MEEPLVIDADFAKLFWKHTDEELKYLREQLLRDGCHDPILFWRHKDQCIIVDGMTRKRLCEELGIPYTTKELKFSSRPEVIRWIIKHQLGRRNATIAQRSMLSAKLSLEIADDAERKKNLRGQPKPQPKPLEGEEQSLEPAAPAEPESPPEPPVNVAKEVAAAVGVSPRTVYRDAHFAAAVNKVEKIAPALADAAKRGALSKTDVSILADAPPEILQKIAEQPEEEWKTAAHAAADAVRRHVPTNRAGKPIVRLRELKDLEQAVGKIQRLNTAALKACRSEGWAQRFHELVRDQLAPVFVTIHDWQVEAEKHGGK